MTTAVNQVGNTLTGSTGTGAFVGANTPTLITPVIGAATGTSLVVSGNLTAGLGAGGSPGTLISFPTTTGKGRLVIAAVDNATGAFDTTLSNATAVGQAQTITFPDAGASTAIVAYTNSASSGYVLLAPSGVQAITNHDITVNGVTVGLGGGSKATSTVVGNGAATATITGDYNAIFGNLTAAAITSGVGNCAFGYETLGGCQSGSYNTGFGYFSMFGVTGSGNSALGKGTGDQLVGGQAYTTSGSNNTYLGFQSSGNNGAITGAIAIGANSTTTIATGATSGDIGSGIAVGSATYPVGFRGNGTIFPTAGAGGSAAVPVTCTGFWQVIVNGTAYNIPLFPTS